MKYLTSAPFSVPVAGPQVSQEDWDNIWKVKCKACKRPLGILYTAADILCHVCLVHLDDRQRHEYLDAPGM